MLPLSPTKILDRFVLPESPIEVATLGNAGGFSGARLWRISFSGSIQPLCLRRWPDEHPSMERLGWIHRVIRETDLSGVDALPVPLEDREGKTIVGDGSGRYELSRWMPGKADFHNSPTKARLSTTMKWLAVFHVASSRLACNRTVAPGIESRARFIDELKNGLLDRIEQSIDPRRFSAASRMCHRFIDRCREQLPSLINSLGDACSCVVPVIPCIRDIWHDHLLFVGDRLSGVVDFGAMGLDSASSDLTRLIGSLVGSDREQWTQALTAYESIRPLVPEEHAILEPFRQASITLAGINWARWIYLEHRSFENRQRVLDRLASIVAQF